MELLQRERVLDGLIWCCLAAPLVIPVCLAAIIAITALLGKLSIELGGTCAVPPKIPWELERRQLICTFKNIPSLARAHPWTLALPGALFLASFIGLREFLVALGTPCSAKATMGLYLIGLFAASFFLFVRSGALKAEWRHGPDVLAEINEIIAESQQRDDPASSKDER
jgi:hypothetical protein